MDTSISRILVHILNSRDRAPENTKHIVNVVVLCFNYSLL